MVKKLPLFIALFLTLGPCLGQQQRDPLRYIEILESADRVRNLQVDRVIQVLDVRKGDQIADVGAGSGLFSRPLARKVGKEGTVYAIDIDPALLDHIRQRARDEGLPQIKTILAQADDPLIPAKVDLILLVDTLHHIEKRPSYLENLKQYLKPDGRIALIDFETDWPSHHEEMRYTKVQLESWMEEIGYTKVAEHPFIKNNFFVVYRLARQTQTH